MKHITPEDFKYICEQADKLGILKNSIRIFETEKQLLFIVKLDVGTSAFHQLQFQENLLSHLAADENLEVVTLGGLDLKVEKHKITNDEKRNILQHATRLKSMVLKSPSTPKDPIENSDGFYGRSPR